MRIKVRFFAGPREAMGTDEVNLELAEGSTVGALLSELAHQYPVFHDYVRFLHLAVNRKYADMGTELHDGDEVVCVPPVGGG